MHDSMLNKLDQLKNRIAEIETLLVDSETLKDIEKYTQLNKEFSELKPKTPKKHPENSIRLFLFCYFNRSIIKPAPPATW